MNFNTYLFLFLFLLYPKIGYSFCGQGLNVFRAFDFSSLSRNTYDSIRKLPTKSDWPLEAYYFQNLQFPQRNNLSISEAELFSIVTDFSKQFYDFMNYFKLDINFLLRGQPLIVLFDNIRDASYFLHNQKKDIVGYFDPTYEEICGRSVIVMDINGLYNNGKKLRKFTHEMSHWVRHVYQPQEERWLDEGIALLIESTLQREYLYSKLDPFQKYPSLNLKFDFLLQQTTAFRSIEDLQEALKDNPSEENEPFIRNSINVLLFLNYVRGHFGDAFFLKKILTSKHSGIDNLFHSIDREYINDLNKKDGLDNKYFKKINPHFFQNSTSFFNNVFLNFQLALGMNSFQATTKSHNNLFDLKLNELSPYIPPDWSILFTKIPMPTKIKKELNIDISIKPWSAHYYKMTKGCLSIAPNSLSNNINTSNSDPQDFQISNYIFDPKAKEEDKIFFKMKNQKYCFSTPSEKYIFIIHWSPLEEDIFLQFSSF